MKNMLTISLNNKERVWSFSFAVAWTILHSRGHVLLGWICIGITAASYSPLRWVWKGSFFIFPPTAVKNNKALQFQHHALMIFFPISLCWDTPNCSAWCGIRPHVWPKQERIYLCRNVELPHCQVFTLLGHCDPISCSTRTGEPVSN